MADWREAQVQLRYDFDEQVSHRRVNRLPIFRPRLGTDPRVELNKRNATTESLEVTRENHKETTAGFNSEAYVDKRRRHGYTAGVVD
jgi:hypothetical protein